MNLKTLAIAAVISVVSTLTLITGCDTSEETLLTAANTAGNLGLSTWFAIDDPDQKVKDVLKEIVSLVGDASAKVGSGETFIDALTPVVQAAVSRHSELTPAQKNLINTGSSIILSSLDMFLATHAEVKGNTARTAKVVSAFCAGCLTAIERSAETAEAKAIKKANTVIRMQYDAKVQAFVAQ